MADLIDQYLQQQGDAQAAQYQARQSQLDQQRIAQQQAVQAQNQDTWYGTLLDNLWTDDFSAIPLIGPAASATATGVTAFYNATSAATSWGQSAFPGGLDTFTWDEARAISPGQAGLADAAARRTQGGLLNQVTAFAQQNAMGSVSGLGTVAQQQFIPQLNDPNFDVTDEAQRTATFQSGGYGQALSGTVDAAVMWFLDPLVVAGKASKVARFGNDALSSIPGVGTLAMGYTNMSLGTARASRWAGEKTDEALAHLDGVEGAQWNKVNEEARFIAENTGDAISGHVMFRNNQYRTELTAIADQIDNERDAVIFLGAAMGNAKYIKTLQQEQLAAFDVLTRARNVNNYEQMSINTALSDIPAILPDTLEPLVGAQLLLDDLTRRSTWLQAAVGEGGIGGSGLLKIKGTDKGSQAITNVGSRSQRMTAMSNAWVAGKAERAGRYAAKSDRAYFSLSDLTDIKANMPEEAYALTDESGGYFEVNDFIDRGYLTAEDAAALQRREAMKETTGPAGHETIYEISAGFRKVKVWSWLTGEHASGYVTVRGIDLGSTDREWEAIFNDGRFSPQFKEEMRGIWGDAINSGAPEARMAATKTIEGRAAEYFANETGADLDLMKEVYERVSNRRDGLTGTFTGNKSAFGVDPDTGFLIAADPVFRSQLETRVPVMDMRLLRKSAEIAARPEYKGLKLLESTETVKNLLDQVSALWKASVLLRLGYTQRNVVEGWLRSAAVLGTVPAIEYAPKGLQRVVWSNRGWSARGRVSTKLKYEQSVVADNIKATQERRLSTEMQLADEEAQWAGMVDGDGVEVFAQQRADYRADIDALRGEETRLTQELIDYDGLIDLFGKRSLGDDGAFHGVNAAVFRDLASSRRTNERVLDSNWGRETAQRMREASYVKVRPESKDYFGELTRAVEQMRRDPAGSLAVQGKSIEEIAAWMGSPAASSYRRTMQLEEVDIPGRAALIHDMVHNYLPTSDARMLAANRIDDFDFPGPKAEELEAVLKNSGADLQPIHGREAKGVMSPPGSIMDAVNKPINWLFKWIGTLPESKLVRQPFYNEVWNRRITQQRNLLVKQLDKDEIVTDEMIAALEVDAHGFALKATEDTLYTIQRLSNPAAALRFIAPFYPAWENSMKVWAGIIMRDPSVAVRASMLWNVPNKLGMVVDKDGNPVNSDPFAFGTGSIDRYIQLPKPLNDIFMKFSGGVPFKVAQNSFNVVTPGSTAWLPGMGPMVTTPVGMILESKPDTQKFLREVLGDAIYQQAVPFGIASGDLTDTVLPAFARRRYQAWQGESNQEYLSVVDAMMQTAMVDWYASGGDLADKPDMDVVRQKANDFYNFTSIAALTLPVSLTRMSKYQTQIDYWNGLKAQPGMTYQQKVDTFLTKWGESYAPLLVSASQSEANNIDPTIETWNVLNENKGLTEGLAQLAPEAVGILGISAPLGQFDQGVYEAYLTSDVPGQPGQAWKSRVAPAEMQTKIELNSAWRDFFAAKARRDAALATRGGMTIDAAANADIKAQWRDFTDNWMVSKYGASWSIAFNDYQQKAAVYLEGVNLALRNEQFAQSETGQSPMWQTIRTYMAARGNAIEAINSGQDSKLVNDQFTAWAENIRFTSLEFADFYDQYLANDKLSIGVT